MFYSWYDYRIPVSSLIFQSFIPDMFTGIPKLRRVLLAYSIHNPETEYCQVYLPTFSVDKWKKGLPNSFVWNVCSQLAKMLSFALYIEYCQVDLPAFFVDKWQKAILFRMLTAKWQECMCAVYRVLPERFSCLIFATKICPAVLCKWLVLPIY